MSTVNDRNPCSEIFLPAQQLQRSAAGSGSQDADKEDRLWGTYAQAISKIRTRPCEFDLTILAELAPHLKKLSQLRSLYEKARDCGRLLFCGPPLRVHGALQVFGVQDVNGVLVVYHAYVYRRAVSYINDTKQQNTAREPLEFQHYEDAEEYACVSWPSELVWDSSESILHGILVEPGQRGESGVQFTAWIDDHVENVLRYTNEPTCEVLDDLMLDVAVWEPVRLELSTGYPSDKIILGHHCALCSAGITDNKCTFCEATFNLHKPPQWEHPVPQLAVAAFVRSGHTFHCDPIEARKAKHREWAVQGFVPDVPLEYRNYGKQQRSVEL